MAFKNVEVADLAMRAEWLASEEGNAMTEGQSLFPDILPAVPAPAPRSSQAIQKQSWTYLSALCFNCGAATEPTIHKM